MLIMFSAIKSAFDLFISIYGFWILAALGFTLFLRQLSIRNKPEEIALVEKGLAQVETFLKLKLGSKSISVIESMRDGIESIKDGDFTDEEMLEQFIKIIKIKTSERSNFPLSIEDHKVIEEAAQMTLNSIPSKKTKTIAIKLLSQK